MLARHEVPDIERCEAQLDRAADGLPSAVEIVYRHAITPDDEFRMDPGWSNFVDLRRGQRLAVDRNGHVGAPMDGRILMPLYQGLGEDGFFVARDVSPTHMQMSAALREHGVGKLLPWLPGIDIDDARGEVRLREPIDRTGVMDVLRLLGYRRELRSAGELRLTRRRQLESQRRGQGGGTKSFVDEE